MLYFTLVFSRIKYGIALYGQAAQTKVKKIQVLQNQLLKVLSKKDFDYSTEKIHKEFKILMVQDIKNHEILTFVHNYYSNSLTPVFDHYFSCLTIIIPEIELEHLTLNHIQQNLQLTQSKWWVLNSGIILLLN